MSDKVEFDLEDLDDLKDLIGDERKRADFSSQKVFSLLVLNWQYFLFSFIIFVSVFQEEVLYQKVFSIILCY